MATTHSLALGLGLALAGITQSVSAQGTTPYPVEVSYLSTSTRQAEDHFRASVVAYADYGVPEKIWDKFLGEHRIGTVLLEADHFFRTARRIADMGSAMREEDARVMQIIEAGGTVMFTINCATPRFNSTRPGMTSSIMGEASDAPIWSCSPPADYGVYAQMAARLVFHFNRKLNTQGRVIYNFGNEPDNYFAGTPADLYAMYAAFATAARSVDPDVKIGGLTPVIHTQNTLSKAYPMVDESGNVFFKAATTASGQPLIKEWIEFSARNHLPIDFVSWHHYPAPNPIPLTTEGPAWIRSQNDISDWLQEVGFQDVNLYLLDWPDWSVDLLEHDTEFYPAHIAAGYIGLTEETRVKPVQTGLQDINEPGFVDLDYARQNAGFGGGVGIFNLIGIAKPVNNLYSMFDRLQGHLIFPKTGNPFIKSVAAIGQDRLAILLTNFVPSERMIHLDDFLQNMSYSEKLEVEWYITTYISAHRDEIDDEILNDKVAFMKYALDVLEGLDLSVLPPSLTKFRDDLRTAVGAVEQSNQQLAAASSIALSVHDLPPGRWALRHYVVDRDHANVYTDRQGVQESLAAALAVNDLQGFARIVDDTNAATGLESGLIESDQWQVQDEEARVLPFDMLPYSVHLVEIQRVDQ